MLNNNFFEIKIVESRPADQLLRNYMTLGLAVTKNTKTAVIQDITDDRAALKAFAEKLKNADFDLPVLGELVDDFLTERYGL